MTRLMRQRDYRKLGKAARGLLRRYMAKMLSKMPMKNPTHPGAFNRTEILEPAGLSVTAAAVALQVSCPALSSLLNGKADPSGEMVLRL